MFTVVTQKKLKIHCCRCVFVVFWARSTAHTSPLASFLIGIAWHNVGPSRCHNRDKMDIVALSYKVDLPQNMQFCPIFGLFLTSRDPQRPSVVPTSRPRMRRTFHRLKKILDHNYAHPFILVVLRK